MAVADPRLRNRVVGQRAAGFGERLRRRLRLSHAAQSLAELLPGLRERARIVSEPNARPASIALRYSCAASACEKRSVACRAATIA
jgi:hypothetical protein